MEPKITVLPQEALQRVAERPDARPGGSVVASISSEDTVRRGRCCSQGCSWDARQQDPDEGVGDKLWALMFILLMLCGFRL